ncbi:hypothetical protein [Andreesenia angusta]|uniref:hypothetical protein n=1 Tax=Andreesenia angusta TaxID=39480 RepID=UPI0014719AFD|nr:hypothetical protein [Andreesenia angusta]
MNVLGIFIVVIISIISIYMAEFSGSSIALGVMVIFLGAVCQYLIGAIDKQSDDNDKLKSENINLKDKVSRISIVANQGSPYSIISLSKPKVSEGMLLNREYRIESIINTLDKKYDINYLNISFNDKVDLRQSRLADMESMYLVTSSSAKERNGRYEYNLVLKEEHSAEVCAKSVFCFTYNKNKDLNIAIDICSEDGITKRDSIEYIKGSKRMLRVP